MKGQKVGVRNFSTLFKKFVCLFDMTCRDKLSYALFLWDVHVANSSKLAGAANQTLNSSCTLVYSRHAVINFTTCPSTLL